MPHVDSDFLLALAHRIVPETRAMTVDEQQHFLLVVDETVASRPRTVQRQIELFLGVVKWLPALRFGAPLHRLSVENQDRTLRWFQDNRIALLRAGFWGVKTLVYMGYYGRPEIGPKIGYTPSLDGNELLAVDGG